MNSEKVYLRQNVLAEPLFNQWYAWSGLIAPATAAMYIANWHTKIMQSFVANPQVHISALKNSAMMGGPFINYDASRVGDIKALLERTVKEQSHMLEFAEAVKALDALLLNEATGYSLEPLYQKIPALLDGYVELVYDLNNNPSVRFIEGLLYRSPYYNESAQSIALSLIQRDDRSFVLSTPRLEDEGVLHLSIPFNSERLDELFKMKHAPQTLDYIRDVLGVGEKDEALFSSFFTDEPPQTLAAYTGDAVRTRYFGHACVLVESKETTILCDPVVSYKLDGGLERYTYADLPERINYAVITHNHQDHCMFETLLQLRHRIDTVIVPRNNGGSLADPSLKLVLQSIGFDDVREIDELEVIRVDGGTITGLPFLGEHGDLNVRTKTAYLIELKEKSMLIGADSNNIAAGLYRHVHKVVGDINTVFLGMECDGAPLSWVYGPLLTRPLARKMDQSRRLDGSNCHKAIEIIKQFNPQEVYVYAMGQEPWLKYITSIEYTPESQPIVESNKLVESCLSRGIVAERLYGCKEI